ncbi:DUF2599 domain-containing protein [Gordonia sinesedis]
MGVVIALLTGCGSGAEPASEASSVVATREASSETTAPPASPNGPSESPTIDIPGQPPESATPSPVLDPANPAPYIDHTEWAETAVGPSLQVYPTMSGRRTIATAARADAWAEVVRMTPAADTPGMAAQFFCHWDFARAIAPDKPSWNLEPQRPVVTDQEMIATRCNPGGPEE